VQPGIPRDLETICLKCLEKEPARRYGSAAGLADDLRRFQQGRPVLARPVSRPERLRRWARREPLAAGLAAVLALAVTAGLATALGLWWTAVGHLRQEEAARREAEDNYLTCRQLLGEYVAVTRDPRMQTPEARQAQREALHKARAFCEELVRRRQGDLGVRRDLAGTCTALAALDLRDNRLREAQEAGETAQALWQQLGDETPADARCADGLAAALEALGLIYCRLGHTPEAEAAMRQAMALWEQLAEKGLAPDRALRNAAFARGDLCILMDMQGRLGDTVSLFEQRYARLNRAITEGPTTPELRLGLLCDLATLGELYRDKDEAAAVRCWQQGREIGRRLVEEMPDSAHAKYFLGVCGKYLAAREPAAALLEETVQLFEQAARLFEAQGQRDPADRTTAHSLASAYQCLSECHRQAGRPAEAVRAGRHAVAVLADLADRQPGAPAARVDVFWLQALLARLERQCGDIDAAQSTAREAADAFERFCAERSDDPDALALAISSPRGLAVVAPPLRHAGAADEVLRVASCCLRVSEELVRKYPDDPRHRVGLSQAWTQLSKTHWSAGRHRETEAALRAAVTAAAQLAERWPEYRPLQQERQRRLERFLAERGRPELAPSGH
jgi:tetratricopeptide (TPR) repeat protein